MILLDTNIISTFSKIGKLELLYDVFNADVLYVSPNVYDELLIAKDKGYAFVNHAIHLFQKKKLMLISLTSKEKEKADRLPSSFSKGERDSIAICRERNGIIVTNEKKVANYCKRQGIKYFDLRDVLKALYILMNFSKNEVNKLMNEIEEKDNIIIKDKEEIFKT